MQHSLPNPAPSKRSGEEQPVQGIHDTRLALAQKVLATPLIGAPKRDSSCMPFSGLELQPGHHLAGQIVAIEPGVLVRQEDTPVGKHHQGEKQGRARNAVG